VFVDTHCHLTMLDLTPYDGDLDLALQQARAVGVHRFMSISVDLDDHIELAKIAARHWAIGETGLDYFHSTDFIAEQKDCFARHIHASQAVKKPVVVHTRSAKHDTVDIIRAEKSTHGILHCFTEDWETAKAVLDCGYYVSFSGIVSFKNAQDLRDVAKQVPLDRLLIETDSPYLAPMPYRGKSNEPKYVPYVAKALADVYDKSLEEMAFITTQNFENLLNMK